MKKSSFKAGMDLWRTPEKVVLVTSIDEQGKPQVISVGWNMRVSFDPPMFAIAVGNNRYMYKCINFSKEFVIAVPGTDLANEVIGCGEPGQGEEDRFKKYGLKTNQGDYCKSPLIENCIANFECLVKDSVKSGDHTIFVGKVMSAWVNEKTSPNLLMVGDEPGYDVLAKTGLYKIGIIRGEKQ
jgi:flavin reductase (DIM6/NTAB) family NADH-FMN oxidoreductase RutF